MISPHSAEMEAMSMQILEESIVTASTSSINHTSTTTTTTTTTSAYFALRFKFFVMFSVS